MNLKDQTTVALIARELELLEQVANNPSTLELNPKTVAELNEILEEVTERLRQGGTEQVTGEGVSKREGLA